MKPERKEKDETESERLEKGGISLPLLILFCNLKRVIGEFENIMTVMKGNTVQSGLRA